MQKRSLIVFSVILSLLFVTVDIPSIEVQSIYVEPLLKVDVDGYHLTAGSENEIVISITNVGEGTAYYVRASLMVPSTVSGMSILNGSNSGFNTIYHQKVKKMYTTLYVASDCPLGAYSLTFELEYTFYNYDKEEYETYVDSMQIGVIVDAIKPEKIDLKVIVEDYSLSAGAENEINILIVNVGEEVIYDVEVALTSESPGIVILKEPSQSFDEIDVEEEVGFRALLGISDNIVLGAYSLRLSLEYKDSKGVTYRDSMAVGVLIDSLSSPRLAFKAEVKNYNVTAGAENEIEVVLTNTGDATIYDVDARLSSTDPQITVLRDISYMFNSIKPNQSASLTSTIGVSSGAPLGPYSLTLRLDYRDPDGVRHTDSMVVGLFVDSVLSHRLAFRAEMEGYRVTAGSENEVKTVLTNMGDAAIHDVDVKVSSFSPQISILKGSSFTFENINPNGNVTLTSILGISYSAPLGAYSLTLTIRYKDADGVSHSDSLDMGILVDSVEPEKRTVVVLQGFQIEPSPIHPGDEFSMIVSVKNLGADAYGTQAELLLDSQSPFVSLGPTLIYIGGLGSNQTADLVYNLQVKGDVKAQPYSLQLSISYYDVYDQLKSVNERLSISIHSLIDFRLIDLQPSSLIVEQGETATIDGELLLVGTEAADFVEIEIMEKPPFVLISESYEYIGRVDPDSPVFFDLEFMVDSKAIVGSYKLSIRVRYWDAYNQVQEFLTDLPVIIGEHTNGSESLRVTFWDLIWSMMRILFGVRP